jgi:hypothetical protein
MGQKNLPTIRANRVNFDLKQPKSRPPTDVVGILPNEDAITRLVGALLLE